MTTLFRSLLAHLFLLLSQLYVYGQPINHYPEIQVGNAVPDYILKNVVNYKTSTCRITDFKGKLLILDFWNTHCAACVASWPKLLELQEKYKNEIQIVLVDNTEEMATVKKTIGRMNKSQHINMNLPVSCGLDTTIEQLFPYESVPNIIWIDKMSILKSVSSGWAFNSKGIESALVNDYTAIETKTKPGQTIPVRYNKPLFIDSNGGKPIKVFWQSIFAKADKDVMYSYGLAAPDNNGDYYISMMNCDIRNLYALAYSNRKSFLLNCIDRLPNSNILLEVKDSSLYVPYINDELRRDNLYTYQLIPPGPVPEDSMQQIMRADLNRYIGLKAFKEKKIRKCLVLTMEDSSLILYKSKKKQFGNWDDTFHINKVSIPALIENLEVFVREYYYSPYPLVDETHFHGELGEIKIPDGSNMGDFSVFNKGLERYKMHLKLEERAFEFLIITEPAGYKFPYK